MANMDYNFDIGTTGLSIQKCQCELEFSFCGQRSNFQYIFDWYVTAKVGVCDANANLLLKAGH